MAFWEEVKDLLKSPQRAAKRTAAEYPWIRKLSELATQIAETPGADIGMVPLGMTKMQYVKKLAEMGASPEVQQAANRVARKVLKNIDVVGTFEELGKTPGWGGRASASIWSKARPSLPSFPISQTKIAFRPSAIKSWEGTTTVGHEPAHDLYFRLSEDLRGLLTKSYRKLTIEHLEDLTDMFQVSLHDASELFSEGYGAYLSGKRHPAFKELPEFFRHVIKQQHKLAR